MNDRRSATEWLLLTVLWVWGVSVIIALAVAVILLIVHFVGALRGGTL